MADRRPIGVLVSGTQLRLHQPHVRPDRRGRVGGFAGFGEHSPAFIARIPAVIARGELPCRINFTVSQEYVDECTSIASTEN